MSPRARINRLPALRELAAQAGPRSTANWITLLGPARQRRRRQHPWRLMRDALRVAWAAGRPEVNGMTRSRRARLPRIQTAGAIARGSIQARWRNLRR
jgi:hypothetical protein